MPLLSLSKRLWCHRRWKQLLALFLIGLFMHSATGAIAQTVEPEQSESIFNTATASYNTPSGTPVQVISNQLATGFDDSQLIDPGGRLLGCDGELLSSYAGFSMALYEPDESGLDIRNLVPLTPTNSDNGIDPNIINLNPFPLSLNDGRYNFLLDVDAPLESPVNAGLTQTDSTAQYILVINPPDNSRYSERRVLIEMLGVVERPTSSLLSYRATSLDGNPISVDGELTFINTVTVRNAEVQLLTLFEFGIESVICEAQQIEITKSADRSAAQPGDTVIYRLMVQSSATVDVDSVVAIDTLPVGFEFLPESVSGQLDDLPVAVTTSVSGNSIAFSVAEQISPDQTLNIIYATRLTPDALRGSGENSAMVTATRTDNDFDIQDGPSIHRVSLEPGILSDCGTLIGRVFEDKNFDGEQQNGEAGIPNAVIFLDDGNRVVTDADGLFSVQKMLPGNRTGTLDLESLPGYTLAANLYFNERNSRSRLVRLAPGGLVRMNFGVTPTFEEGE
ncbi:DUF11 domain-containing protein [cf. Phormidesmis sp. LEGE 11477]|uniref:DUF11 domain-containing protein n=1 Tax=cf. Phormidesmis sp. LEGE 11477 TaxID=1828680 RepID=UPI00187F863B|nr:DUF11 domain-containing protein [cf. Phormidesmis sp. LEGE 11477]MBE9064391.1 DUF11 domain-containing protein [cf. Phormidesmis sp. LEGE 11477]